jgi:hypothetical protein
MRRGRKLPEALVAALRIAKRTRAPALVIRERRFYVGEHEHVALSADTPANRRPVGKVVATVIVGEADRKAVADTYPPKGAA